MDEEALGVSSDSYGPCKSQENHRKEVRKEEALNLLNDQRNNNTMELDTEGTNCSETMSTNDDDEDYRQVTESRARSRAVRERINTPAHQQRPQLRGRQKEERKSTGEASNFSANCDDNQQATSSDNSYYLMSTAQLQQNDETPSTGELSELASANCLAPPSYGTATNPASNCAPLDAGQLQQIHQMRLAEQNEQQLVSNSNYSTTCYFSNTDQLQQQQQQYSSSSGTLVGGIALVNANANANANAPRECSSLFGKTIAHTIDQQGKQQQYYHQSQSSGANGASSHNGLGTFDPTTSLLLGTQVLLHMGQSLPKSATSTIHGYQAKAKSSQLPLFRCTGETPLTHINVAHNTNDLRSHPINLDPDNNQTFAHGPQQQQQQQQHQNLPINHVISERGSLTWQPQTNQYRACATLPGLAQNGRANPPTAVLTHDAGQSYEPRAQGSNWVMDVSASSGTNGKPTPANRNGPLQLTDSTTNGKVSSQDAGPWQLAQVLHPASSDPNHNQATNQSKNTLQSQTSSPTPIAAPVPCSNSTSEANQLLSLLARSNESLPASSATLGRISGATSRARREQLQSAHYRKRRRHRSTSGRSVSPSENCEPLGDRQVGAINNLSNSLLRPTTTQAYRSRSATQTLGSVKQRQQAISAHCWLIDSSDDQTYASASKSKPKHLTMAITKQTAQQHQQQLLLKGNRTNQASTAEWISRATQIKAEDKRDKEYETTTIRQPIAVHRDLTSDLRTNSLRMERILNKPNPTQYQDRAEIFPTNVSVSNLQQQTLPSKSRQEQERQHRTSSNSSEESELDKSSNRAGSRNGEQASTVLRLSALLTLISNLVKRPRSLRVSQSSHSVPQMPNCTQMNPAPVNSVSGSMPSNRPPYVLAISSSSSTSAYATESSHQSSNGSAGQYRANFHIHNSDPPILLSQLRAAVSTAAGSSAGSASLFYSTSGLSGSATQPSSHGYEYCDQTFSETKFALAESTENLPPEPEASDERSSSSTVADGIVKVNRAQQLLPHSLMSDSELISAGSEAGFPVVPEDGPNTVVLSSLPTSPNVSARRRWRWFSFKNWLKRKTIIEEEPVFASDTGEASRYKALRSNRRLDSPPSLIGNVISLAKADRIFRWRLIASVIVSCILVALICLLIGLLYARSSAYERNKLNLLIDDSDYDLAWLWSPNNLHQHQPSSYSLPSSKLSEQPVVIDTALKAQLLMVERSEHLNQFQLSAAYLTNLQLASDKFIDITQLAQHLASPPNSTSDSLQLNEADQELVSLVLLSNLHWPLVKWKHQSQQSVASFLSFAMNPAPLSGVQTLRNLLSALLLSESLPKIPANLHPTLNQFVRLNSLLRSSSFHIISCSYWLGLKHTNSQKLRVDFCIRVISKYKRMMQTLSRLDQNQRTKLQDQLDIGLELGQPKRTRSLAGFFLDRLAILEPDTIALTTVMLADESFIGANVNQTLVALLGVNYPLTVISSDHADILNKWRTTESLFEMTKLVVGSVVEQADGSTSYESEPELPITDQSSEETNQLLVKELLYPWTISKLPPSITPLNYDLFLHPNLTSKLILGMVKIEFQVEWRTNFIIIHCSRLNLIELNVWMKQSNPTVTPISQSGPQSSLKQLTIRRILVNPSLDQLYIELQEPLEPWTALYHESQDPQQPSSFNFANELPLRDTSRRRNQFLVSISFNKTSLQDSGPEPGLEFVSYGDPYALPEAELKTMMYTQFEPTNARRLFPAFDEPHLKAHFQLNLVHELQHQVLFNAPKRERVPYTSDGSLQMSVFEPVPVPLSTYLIAFVICDVHNIKSITSRASQFPLNQPTGRISSPVKHVQVQVLAQFEQLGQAEFASQLVPELLQYYQSLFQFPYPLEKLDLVAIPRELPVGKGVSSMPQQLGLRSSQSIDTMENLGLIWFKASLLLADPNLISQNLIEQVAMLISHQLAHQFFGNILSVRNWQDLWLYEALCQYLESLVLSNVQTDWRLEEQFPVTTIQETLAFDSFEETLTSHHPDLDPTDTNEHLAVTARLESSDNVSSEIQAPNLPEAVQLSRKIFDIQDIQSVVSPIELKRSSAILHMLLLNLLPTDEARARLLRRCLHLFKYSTMSSHQFWIQFAEFLSNTDSGSLLNGINPLNSLEIPEKEQPTGSLASETLQLELSNQNRALSSIMNQTVNVELEQQNERVVFVRAGSRVDDLVPLNERSSNDVHKIQIRTISSSSKLERVADAWSERKGYPLVTTSAYRDRIHLRQERFSFSWWTADSAGAHLTDSHHLGLETRVKRSVHQQTSDDIWPIPLLMVSHINQRNARFFWLDKRQMEIPLVESQTRFHLPIMSVTGDFSYTDSKKGSINAWYKLNVNQTSLVRVNYDDRNWEALTELLVRSHYSNHLLSSLDRANLLDDAFTLMRHGRLSLGIAMNLTLYLEVAERDYMPWASALMHLDQMQTLLNQNPLWHRYVLRLIRPISSVIGWKDDGPHLMRKLRRNLFSVALQYGDEKTIAKAKQEFKGWQKSRRFIVPNLQELVYVAGVRYGDQQEWFHCWQKYQQLVALDLQNGSTPFSNNYSLYSDGSTHGTGMRQAILTRSPSIISGLSEPSEPNTENEKRQLLTALASTQNTWLLEQFLNYSLDPTKIQPQHLKHVMQTLGKNPVARLYLWRFLRLNWNTLTIRYIGGDETILVIESKGYRPISSTLAVPQENYQILETLIVESTRHFASKLDYEEVKSFFETKQKQLQERLNIESVVWNSAFEKAILQSLQIIRSNIYWREYIEPKMTQWLSHYDGENIS